MLLLVYGILVLDLALDVFLDGVHLFAETLFLELEVLPELEVFLEFAVGIFDEALEFEATLV